MRIMEDETYHESGQEFRQTAAMSPEHKLTANKLERHNQSLQLSSSPMTSRTHHSNSNNSNNTHQQYSNHTANLPNSLFPAASVLATARSSRLVSSGRSDAGTMQSNMSVAESVISRATARKGKF